MLLPGTALLAGGLPVQLLRSRRSASGTGSRGFRLVCRWTRLVKLAADSGCVRQPINEQCFAFHFVQSDKPELAAVVAIVQIVPNHEEGALGHFNGFKRRAFGSQGIVMIVVAAGERQRERHAIYEDGI
jgi:hypothetical protein